MQERDPLIAVIDPEQRGADALRKQQARGAANEAAEHVRDGGITQLPFEADRQQRQADAERHIESGIIPEGTQHEGGVRHRSENQSARV